MIGFGGTEKEAALKIIEECYQAFEARGIQGINDLEKRYAEDRSETEPQIAIVISGTMHNKIYEGKSITEFFIHHINKKPGLASGERSLLVTQWILTIDEINGALVYRLEDSLNNQ